MIQVRARDRDADLDRDNPAGKIEYSIVSTHKHFKIDAETGWLSTNKVGHSIIPYQIINLTLQWDVIPSSFVV